MPERARPIYKNRWIGTSRCFHSAWCTATLHFRVARRIPYRFQLVRIWRVVAQGNSGAIGHQRKVLFFPIPQSQNKLSQANQSLWKKTQINGIQRCVNEWRKLRSVRPPARMGAYGAENSIPPKIHQTQKESALDCDKLCGRCSCVVVVYGTEYRCTLCGRTSDSYTCLAKQSSWNRNGCFKTQTSFGGNTFQTCRGTRQNRSSGTRQTRGSQPFRGLRPCSGRSRSQGSCS